MVLGHTKNAIADERTQGDELLRRGSTRSHRLSRTLVAGGVAVLAGGTTLGLVSVAGLAVGPLTQAGADSSAFTLVCNGTGNSSSLKTLKITGSGFTGRLPGSVTPGKGFSLSNYALVIALPSATPFPAAGGHSISGTYTTSVSVTGASPASQAVTMTVPNTAIPKPAPGTKLTASGPSVNFTAGN